MIQVLLTQQEHCFSLEVSGHANTAGKGQDLLCSAVSGMAQMMEIGVNKILGLKKNWKKEKDI